MNQSLIILKLLEIEDIVDLRIRKLNDKFNQDIEYNIDQQQFLANQLDQEKNIFDDRIGKKDEIKKVELEKMNEEKSNELRELRQKIDELNNELNPLRHYHDREKQLQDRIEQLRREERDKELAHHDELQRQEKDQSQKLVQMTNINDAKIDDHKKSAPKAAEKDARDREQQKIEENLQLRQKLIIRQRDVQELRRERDLVLKQNKHYKLNLQVNKEGILEYQVVNQKQENKIKQLKEEVEQLKQKISDDVTKQTKDLEFMKLQDKQKREELMKEITFLKNEIRIKGDELRKVKSLAEIIVDQRSDIEQFFLEALQNVKEQISQKYKISKKSHSLSSSLKLPEISMKSNKPFDENKQQNNSKFYSDRVDITELDLEEKEKLLRILFRKMNLGVQPLQPDDNR